MTRALLGLAVLAMAADALAYAVLIRTGHASELNPIWAAASLWLALAAKALVVVVLVALTSILSERVRVARAVLVVAILAGVVGAVSTLGAVA